jgi:hypothetical protein
VGAQTYRDPYGVEFKVTKKPVWTKSLGNQILIVDMDTRVPNKTNELLNDEELNWETMDATHSGGMVSAAFMNHYLYGKIFRGRSISSRATATICVRKMGLTHDSTNPWL